MRNLINITEDKNLKKEIIDVVKATDDLTVLQRVLNTLKAGNIDERIKSVIGKDGDAQTFIKQIVKAILEIEAPIEEKNAFLDRYAKEAIVDSSKLLNGKLSNFAEIVGTGFALELFNRLTVELVSQGVGPGEVALAVLSPNIQWSGRVSGGGDIIVNKKPVEVKARAKEGGRWINATKAKLDTGTIFKAMSTYMPKKQLPDRVNTSYWVDTIRPTINPRALKQIAKEIADATFKFADNSLYQKALVSGDASAIVNAYLDVGYNNYKSYSGFDGMLIMDIPTQQLQYFAEYKDMAGQITVDTVYLLAPEREMMPRVVLAPGAGPLRAGRFKSDTSAIATATQAGNKTDIKKKVAAYAKKICDHYGVTDLNVVKQVETVILQDLSHNVDPSKIPARLAKVFPELGARKKVQPQQAEPTEVQPMRQRRGTLDEPLRQPR
jgi:hypothetical protein